MVLPTQAIFILETHSIRGMLLTESGIVMFVASFGALVAIVFTGLRRSRCVEIDFCWGALKCSRKNLTPDELKYELDRSPHNSVTATPQRPPRV